jgi:hypothetical protein
VLELGLLADDGHPRLELRRLHVGHEAPLEARHQPLFHLVELLGVLVAGDDDLLAGLVKRVERVKELLLRLRLACKEVDVVDQEQVAPLAEAVAEVVHALVLEGLHEFVHEALGADVDDARARPLLPDAIGDRVHEVRFAEPRAPADEQRVVAASAHPRRRHRRGVRQLVRRPHDEVGERVLLVQSLDGRRNGRHLRRFGNHGMHARFPVRPALGHPVMTGGLVPLERSRTHRQRAWPHRDER